MLQPYSPATFTLQGIFLALVCVKRLSHPLGRIATGRIMSMKNSNDTTGDRSRDLPACSAVPQLTAPKRAPNFYDVG